MTLPPVRLVRQNDTHRLIPSMNGEAGDSVLAAIADDDAHLRDLFDLDQATNDRLLAENALLPGIEIHELLFGVVYPSVRRRGGTCLACFRPALVMNVREKKTYRFRWDGAPKPSISVVR